MVMTALTLRLWESPGQGSDRVGSHLMSERPHAPARAWRHAFNHTQEGAEMWQEQTLQVEASSRTIYFYSGLTFYPLTDFPLCYFSPLDTWSYKVGRGLAWILEHQFLHQVHDYKKWIIVGNRNGKSDRCSQFFLKGTGSSHGNRDWTLTSDPLAETLLGTCV